MTNPIAWLLDRLWYEVANRIMPTGPDYEPEVVG
jgi:hypothetical protein